MHRVYDYLVAEHDLRLLGVAAAICLFAALTSFTLGGQVRGLAERHRTRWIAGMAFASGSGIWATHFIAMLAYRPHAEGTYALPATLLSYLLSLGFCFAAMSTPSRLRAAVLVTGGIATMHFVGMAAIQGGDHAVHDLPVVALACLAGFALVGLSIWSFQRRPRAFPLLPALLFVLAVITVHLGSMAAMTIIHDGHAAVPAAGIDSGGLAIAVAALMIAVLVATIAMFYVESRLVANAAAEAERLARLVHRDPLTGADNRAAFTAILSERLRAACHERPLSVLCIDLDRFRAINELYGHSAGDAVLIEASRRIVAELGPDDGFARLGGDEFAVVTARLPSDASALAERLRACLAAPIDAEGHPVVLDVSIGIACAPADAHEAKRLYGKADLALHRAKSDGRGRTCFFDPAMDERIVAELRMRAELRKALARGEFSLHYQPIACMETGGIIGFEALLRWNSPLLGPVPPATFIPLAEETGDIVAIGEWVLREAAREAARRHRKLKIAVNLSPVQFSVGDIVALVASVLEESGLEPQRLDLEITEGLLLKDAEGALHTLRRLKTLGVRVSMDDFGTGYSSLGYFRQFPFDKVKIDQGFVRDMAENPQSRAIIRAIIGLGRGLNMTTLAEGVETAAQVELLKRKGCHQIQGYVLSRPAPIGNFEGEVMGTRQGSHACANECATCPARESHIPGTALRPLSVRRVA
jgi:diguanylate cyclase (GGDEF)-like protein